MNVQPHRKIDREILSLKNQIRFITDHPITTFDQFVKDQQQIAQLTYKLEFLINRKSGRAKNFDTYKIAKETNNLKLH